MKTSQQRSVVLLLTVVMIALSILNVQAQAVSKELSSPGAKGGLVKDQVDWPTFLARHDLVWNRLGKSYFDAPFVGNGLLGAMIWQESDHAMHLDIGRTDVCDHRSGPDEYVDGRVYNGQVDLKGRLPIGRFLLTTVGKIRGGTMRLRLHDAEAVGVVETHRGRIRWRLFTHAEQPVNVVELWTEGEEQGCSWAFEPAKSVVECSWIKDPSRVNPPASQETRGEVHVCVQTRTAGGDYATAWQEAPASGGCRRLLISIADRFPDSGAAESAVAAVRRAAAESFDNLVASHRGWWHAYYPASFVSIPHARMESFYWIQMYKLGSSIRKGGPLCDLMGPWYKKSMWPGIWWNLNTQMLFWPFPTANRLEMAENLSDALEEYKANLVLNVPAKFRDDSSGISRLSGPDLLERYDLYGEQADLVWTCHNLWLQYRYSMDDRFLRAQLYPLLRRAVNLYLHLLTTGKDGKYHTPVGCSPEAFSCADTNFDLASLRWGCETLLWIDKRLGTRDPLAPRWRDVLTNLVEYAVDENGFMGGPGQTAPRGHRHWSHLIAMYPYYVVNWDQLGWRDTMERSWSYWAWDDVPNSWSQAIMCSMAASMGKSEPALHHLNRALDGPNIAANTMHTEDGNPCSETHAGMCQMLHDMLLQSWGDKIRVFPAVPASWTDVTLHNFRTEGAFLVSAVRKDGKTLWVRVKSLAGERCRIQPSLEGEVKVYAPCKSVSTRKIGAELYELSLKPGDEVLLCVGDQIPAAVVLPVPIDPARNNPYVDNSATRR